MNDLNQLNDALFDTLQKVRAGKMDPNQADTIVNISKAITDAGKLQLATAKFFNSESAPKLLGVEEGHAVQKIGVGKNKNRRERYETDKHAAQMSFANEKGYENVATAIQKLTPPVFTKQFDEWMNTDKVE